MDGARIPLLVIESDQVSDLTFQQAGWMAGMGVF
jgi:hypothetical protein